MEIPPPHVLAQLDAIIVGQSRAANDGARATLGPREVLKMIHFCWAEVAQIRNFNWLVAGAHAHGHIFQVMP